MWGQNCLHLQWHFKNDSVKFSPLRCFPGVVRMSKPTGKKGGGGPDGWLGWDYWKSQLWQTVNWWETRCCFHLAAIILNEIHLWDIHFVPMAENQPQILIWWLWGETWAPLLYQISSLVLGSPMANNCFNAEYTHPSSNTWRDLFSLELRSSRLPHLFGHEIFLYNVDLSLAMST